jgi:RNA polymerase sigma-70 factor (ECF subfamily)
MASDKEIEELLASGRAVQAFEMLMNAFQHKVFRLAYAMLGERSRAEDAAQETLLRVWKALPQFRGGSAISTWIYTIARNCCLTAIQRSSGKRTSSLEEPGVRAAAEVPGRVSQAPLPDVERMVAELPDECRSAVMLYYMQEKSYDETARALGIPLGTLKTRLHRARRLLAEKVVTMKEGDSGDAVRRV